MSVEAFNWVREHAETGNNSERLVLVMLAHCAHADGSSAYPSVGRLQRWTQLSRRQVQRSLRGLCERDLIVPEGFTEWGAIRYRVVTGGAMGDVERRPA